MTEDPGRQWPDQLVQWLIDHAGGIKELSARTKVPARTLNRWRRGGFPRARLTEAVEEVHRWAVTELNGEYPPPGYPADGLLAFVGKSGDEPNAHGQRETNSVPSKRKRWWRQWFVIIPATLATITAITATIIVLQNSPTATVIVSNKVAFRGDKYGEDTTPTYLSSRPVANCAAHGCKLLGTDMWSGFALTVTCRLQAEQMTNYDTTSGSYGQNPNAYYSDLWYRGSWLDGRSGYISYIYIAPGYRTGMGLPDC